MHVITSFIKPVSLKRFTEAITSIPQLSAIQQTSDTLYLPSVQDITEAILKKEFIVYYQPQINFNENTLFGFEALVRWLRPEQIARY